MIRERGNPLLHFLDRYVGVPAIAALGCMRRLRPVPSRINSIGLLKAGAIGDTVLMSGVIADLREAFPLATLVFFAGRSNLEIAEMIDGIDRVVEVPVKHLAAGIKGVRSVPVDVMIDFGQWSRLEALLALSSRTRCTIGFRTPGQHRHYGYDLVIDHSFQVHELDNFRNLARALGVLPDHAPSLCTSRADERFPFDYAAFHLWSAGRRRQEKLWPLENWIRLMKDFRQRGIGVVLTGGPSDRDRNEEIIARVQACAREHVWNVAGLSLKETCAILAGARLVVSIDTGIMHMAAALGAPLVCLHGPTSSRRWGPVSANAIAIDSPLAESGYLNLGWECPSQPSKCMEAISYETVRDACQAALEKLTMPKL